MSTLTLTKRAMSKAHQGAMVREWVEKNHNSINSLAGKIAADAPAKERHKVLASIVNLVGTSISKHEFLSPSWHRKWEQKITPHIGYTLEDVLKEMGEDSERSQGYVTPDYQKELYILKGKYEAAKEANEMMISRLGDILLSFKNN